MIEMAQIKLTDSEVDAAVRVLRSGSLRQGRECDGFEAEFAAKVGAKHAVTCANGTAALHLAYMAFLEQGDEVLVPSFTFIATGSMVTLCGGKPILCDVDPATFLLDLKDAERKITRKTRAIAPVHLFGNPCDMQAVAEFSRKHNLTIVWDAAQAHGARYHDGDIGGFGDFVCYSFYPSKNMFVGEGGMICTNNDQFDHLLRYLRTHGQTGKYIHTMLGLNYRMTDVEAAIGRQQLQRLDEMLELRSRNARLLTEGLSDLEGIRCQRTTPSGQHAWHQFCVVIDPVIFGCDRDTLAIRLKEKGISTGVHYPRGLHQQPVFKELYGEYRLPSTEHLAEHILAIPVHHGLSEADVLYIIDSIRTRHE
ncbi:DegT/DnrJ/EryC1/StrS family aminotransferase [Desulfoferrobacter suflitae]|uniref:DegT/DnrJ/EryC1/StrS family aminotransferase n=1 Tax=Desulfoferrobacter suflitae TaxID=2865782 RepID=UPI002164B64D|nr:DegT/DnrJ/EryC1/StrS family aminotransferase [Desulfoferrobacter suflitae]MCK8604351.1 DegT/DnrJ/EryC1/StrS family aminotransferase [Desulfoferrobacter suflitae]